MFRRSQKLAGGRFAATTKDSKPRWLALRGVARNGGPMDRKTAHEVFATLEEFARVDEHPGTDEDGQPLEAEQLPVYDVRFDATTNQYDERQYRVRVSIGASSNWHGRRDWGDVLLLANEHDLGVKIDNGAMELT